MSATVAARAATTGASALGAAGAGASALGSGATGAGFWATLTYGVVPQVMARFVGFSAYQLDSNLRNSTMVGIIGGGGIGATLFTAYQRFDYDFVLTILIVIIAIIMVSEALSAWLRRLFQ